jgi:hypothetical protein
MLFPDIELLGERRRRPQTFLAVVKGKTSAENITARIATLNGRVIMDIMTFTING